MPDTSARADYDRHPVIYAGRFADRIAGADLPDPCTVLGEQDALPHKLAGTLDHANTLVVLDVLSFPFETMTDDHWNVPIVAVLAPDLDVESLITPPGSAFFERLGFFDLIAAPDAVWEELRRRYGWAESQRLPVVNSYPAEAIETVCALLESASSASPETHGTDLDPYSKKALHRAQAAVLEPRFAAIQEELGVPLDVLEVGTGTGRWALSFDRTKIRFVGIDAREDLIGAARANFPDQRFDLLGSDLLFPYEDESFDLVFSVRFMHHYPASAKRTLLSEMWRVARPGGRLLFLEDFVFTRGSEAAGIHPMSVTEFEDLILDATAGQVALEYVESLRYADEDLHRGGLISLMRLGVSKIR